MQYSLVTRDLEREHIPVCTRFGLGVLPWSPLAGGFLSGKYGKDQAPPPGTRLEKWKERLASFDNPRNWRILEAVKAVAEERQSSATAVALRWAIQKPGVSSVIFGARSVAQLEDNLKAAELVLTNQDMKRLDDASAFDLGYPYGFMAGIQSRW
jgi:aryl-alcohol dehydrogenase-like predicted oxidoreductase